jgi:hypothetical protein
MSRPDVPAGTLQSDAEHQETDRRKLTIDEVFQAILDQDPEEQRQAWLEFRRAIDEDRVGDQKYYPCSDE